MRKRRMRMVKQGLMALRLLAEVATLVDLVRYIHSWM